jgi:hypothetical protein
VAGISYFQRYSQRENHVTNNTLLVLRHLYQTAPGKLEQVVREILGQEAISLGLAFHQQTKGSASVPDGLISQAPFRLYFETKLGPSLDRDQILRHIKSIADDRTPAKGEAFLVGLSTESMPAAEREFLAAEARLQGVVFAPATFADLVAALDAACAPHDVALRAVLDDFNEFLASENLLFQSDDWMLVVPCGVSLADNQRFGIYYDGVDRPKRSPCAFLGAYSDKAIRLVGRITAVLICRYADCNAEVVEIERGTRSDDALRRITAVIEATSYYDLKSGPERYYVVDEFAPTNLTKRDRGPVRGAQYLQLSPLLPKGIQVRGLSSKELAQNLDGRCFPPEVPSVP